MSLLFPKKMGALGAKLVPAYFLLWFDSTASTQIDTINNRIRGTLNGAGSETNKTDEGRMRIFKNNKGKMANMIKVNDEARKVVLKDIRIQSAICTATGKGHSTVLRWLYKANAEKLSQMVVSDIIYQRTGLNIVDYAAAQHQ